MPKQPSGLFTRIVKADAAGAPLRLRPGDVMQLANFFAEMEITRQSQFENLSASGHWKRAPIGTKRPKTKGNLPASRD